MTSSPEPLGNLRSIDTLLKKTQPQPDSLVVLPECFAAMGGPMEQLHYAEQPGNGPLQQSMADFSRQYGVWILAGTLPLKTGQKNKVTASSLLFSPEGECRCRYDKIHLFDANVCDNTGSYCESTYIQAGEKVCVFDMQGIRVGIAICYDLRFPELFRKMQEQGVELILLPAAFTRVTGEAHWHTLLRARAIENQCFITAVNQTGKHENNRETWGHSLVFDPWGNELVNAGSEVGVITTSLDFSALNVLREQMPVLKHRRL